MLETSAQSGSSKKKEARHQVMYWSDAWAWFWMVPMMFLWALVLGAVVYAAVRLANHDSHRH